MENTRIPYPELDTPATLIDLDKLESNIKEMAKISIESGVRLRPHVKVHTSAFIVGMQLDAGACGIEVSSVDQAIAFAKKGFTDMVIAHPFYGKHKLAKLRELLYMPNAKVAVVVDMLEQAETISKVGQEVGKKVPIIIKVEVGGDRFGVIPREPTVALAKEISMLPGVEFIGINTHEVYSRPSPDGLDEAAQDVLSIMNDTATLLKQSGLPTEHVSVGSSATWRAVCREIKGGNYLAVNEIHPGTCIIGSMIQVHRFAMTPDQCALSILADVMSISHEGHAVINVGIKTLGGDPLLQFSDRPDFYWKGKPSYAMVKGHPELWLGSLSAEVSRVFYRDSVKKLTLGERLELIPNNPFAVINAQDKLYGVRKSKIEKVIRVTGRGKGT